MDEQEDDSIYSYDLYFLLWWPLFSCSELHLAMAYDLIVFVLCLCVGCVCVCVLDLLDSQRVR